MNNHYEIIIKPINKCNLNCLYCYDNSSISSKELISLSVCNKIFTEANKLIKEGNTISFIWHGSEPLLTGIDNFQKIINYQKRILPNDKYHNCIQTNATLINKEWVDLIKDNEINLGLSIDGPQEIHDFYRIDKNGKGSFSSVFSNIKLLQKEKIRFGTIAVISKKSSQNVSAIYDFFKENNINWKFNPLISNNKNFAISPLDFGQFMIDLFDLWYNDKNIENTIITFEQFIENILSYKRFEPCSCNHSVSCQDYFISISSNGDIYPCNRFDYLEEYKLGNINTSTLKDIFKHRTKQALKNRSFLKSKCLQCDYFNICYSGCPYNALIGHNDLDSKDIFCESYKMIFEKITNVIYREVKL